MATQAFIQMIGDPAHDDAELDDLEWFNPESLLVEKVGHRIYRVTVLKSWPEMMASDEEFLHCMACHHFGGKAHIIGGAS